MIGKLTSLLIDVFFATDILPALAPPQGDECVSESKSTASHIIVANYLQIYNTNKTACTMHTINTISAQIYNIQTLTYRKLTISAKHSNMYLLSNMIFHKYTSNEATSTFSALQINQQLLLLTCCYLFLYKKVTSLTA